MEEVTLGVMSQESGRGMVRNWQAIPNGGHGSEGEWALPGTVFRVKEWGWGMSAGETSEGRGDTGQLLL